MLILQSVSGKDDNNQVNLPVNQTYEKFLEATGLSQKSILTPTRMFSNHRLVLFVNKINYNSLLFYSIYRMFKYTGKVSNLN